MFRLLRRNRTLYPWVNDLLLNVQWDQSVATLSYLYGIQDLREFQFMQNFLSRSDVFVDMGGNIGTYSIFASGVIGCQVHTFEPDVETSAILRKNVRLNGLENLITVHDMALGSKIGETEFSVGLKAKNRILEENELATRNTLVKISTLDSLGLDGVSIIKIDIEGNELSALKGSVETLNSETLFCLIIEMNLNPKDSHDIEIFKYVSSFGFSPIRYSSDGSWEYSSYLQNSDWNTIFVRGDLDRKRNLQLEKIRLFGRLVL